MVIVETDMLVDLGETAPQAGGRFPGRICPVEPLLIVPRRLAGGCFDSAPQAGGRLSGRVCPVEPLLTVPRSLAGGFPDAPWRLAGQTGGLA